MKRRIQHGITAAILITIACFAGRAPAQEGGRITRVVLYPGSATVERSVRVAPAQTKVELTGLPANFDARTLRVDADAGIQIGEVAVRDLGRAQTAAAREAGFEAKIQALKDEKALLDTDAKAAELVRDYLAHLGAGTPDKGPSVLVDQKSIAAVIEAIRRGGVDAYAVMHRVEVKKRSLDKQIAALERDLARIRSGAPDARNVTVSLAGGRGGELRVSYQVANAGWRPAYRAALDSAASALALERQASITQSTGEDWSGVTLKLSTGQPHAAALIDPRPLELALQPPASLAAYVGRGRQEARTPAKAMAEEPKPSDEPPAVSELQTQYATEFDVAGKVDLPADGRWITVSLAKLAVRVKQRVRVVPRRDTAAMVTAEAERPEGVWLTGEVQLYRDGSYIGSTHWNPPASERLILPFGRDDRIRVSVNRVKNRSGTTGFTRRNERQVADRYTIASSHKAAVDLIVLEASPVAVSDQISVHASFDPKPTTENWREQRGVVAWEQPLAPGQSVNLTADYTITYPRDASVIGLP